MRQVGTIFFDHPVEGLGCSKQRWHYLVIKSILALNQLDLTDLTL
jgi:hypothetical protein